MVKKQPLSATPRIATGTLDRFAGANEGAGEFSIHFRRQPSGVDAGLGQERASIFEAVDAPRIGHHVLAPDARPDSEATHAAEELIEVVRRYLR